MNYYSWFLFKSNMNLVDNFDGLFRLLNRVLFLWVYIFFVYVYILIKSKY